MLYKRVWCFVILPAPPRYGISASQPLLAGATRWARYRPQPLRRQLYQCCICPRYFTWLWRAGITMAVAPEPLANATDVPRTVVASAPINHKNCRLNDKLLNGRMHFGLAGVKILEILNNERLFDNSWRRPQTGHFRLALGRQNSLWDRFGASGRTIGPTSTNYQTVFQTVTDSTFSISRDTR